MLAVPFLTLRMFSSGHQYLLIRMNESVLSFSQRRVLLLETAVLAAMKRQKRWAKKQVEAK